MRTIHIGMWTPDEKFHALSLDEKINLVENEFKKARELALRASKDQDSTFIFLCPEYTFLNLSDPQTNTYNKQDVAKLKKRFSTLAATYPDSIIIPGTILIKKTLHMPDDVAKKKKYIERFFGAKAANHLNHLNIDEHNQLLDAISSGKALTQNAAYIFSAHAKPPGYKKKAPSGDIINKNVSTFMPGHNSAMMEINGISMGIQICADHCVATLTEEQKGNNKQVSIHLVLSRTVALEPTNLAKGATIAVNCAGDYVNDKTAQDNTGVWIFSGEGQPNKLTGMPSQQTLIFPNITIPTITPRPRAKL